MRKRLTILMVLWAGVAAAAVINSQGTAGAPLSVSTVAKVLAGQKNRTSWCIEPETVSVRCMVGGINDAAPSPTASSTVGFLIGAGVMYCDNSGFNSNLQATVDPKQRLDCASTGSATNVSTWESY